MDVSIGCPTCQRRLRVPALHLGKRVRCPGCATVFETERRGPASSPSGRTTPDDPYRAPETKDLGEPERAAAQFRVKVVRDPERHLRGTYLGAITGALAGVLVTANAAIARKEHLSLRSRVAACLGATLLGLVVLVAAVVAIGTRVRRNAAGPVASAPAPAGQGGLGRAGTLGPAETPAPARGWGVPEDPDGDCQVRIDGRVATLGVPGSVHELSVKTGRVNAPRILQAVDGDFTATVTLDGDDRPAEPPALGSHVAFHGAGLLLWGGPDHFVRLERAAVPRGGMLNRHVLFELHGLGIPFNGQEVPYDGSRITLRLERRGDRVSGAFTTDGSRWITLIPKSFAAPTARVGVAALNMASTTFVAEFQDYRLERP